MNPRITDSIAKMSPARLVGQIRGREAGPMLLAIGGLHGNEPAGVLALRRVFATLSASSSASSLRGDVVMLAGNVRALAQRRRFLQRDLNRGWNAKRLAALQAAELGPDNGAEDFEQLELAAAVHAAIDAARGPVHLLDLHTTSAAGLPFAMTGDAAAERAFARHVPLVLVLGLLEAVHETFAVYLRGCGCTVLAVEGGQNDSPQSLANHEAVLWLALVGAGLLPEAAVSDVAIHRAGLERARGNMPRAIRVHYRHALAPDNAPRQEFRMQPGYANIQRIARGELIAYDRSAEIRAPEDGYLLLPLYQQQGDDGFFLGSEAVEPV